MLLAGTRPNDSLQGDGEQSIEDRQRVEGQVDAQWIEEKVAVKRIAPCSGKRAEPTTGSR